LNLLYWLDKNWHAPYYPNEPAKRFDPTVPKPTLPEKRVIKPKKKVTFDQSDNNARVNKRPLNAEEREIAKAMTFLDSEHETMSDPDEMKSQLKKQKQVGVHPHYVPLTFKK
jgi:hypothetical protein